MSGPTRSIDLASIVLRGVFNPKIFSPAWMLAEQLIGPGDYSDADVQVITSDIAVFRVGSITLNAARDSVQVATTDASDFERVRDMGIGLLHSLGTTPIGALGVNRAIHYSSASIEEWHNVGNAFAPKDVWVGFLESPGMRSLTMWGVRQDEHAGHVQVQVEPSVLVHPGIYAAHNDHFELAPADESLFRENLEIGRELSNEEMSPGKAKYAIRVLGSDWQRSMDRAEEFFALVAAQNGGAS